MNSLVKCRMTRDHNGYTVGEVVELEHAVADAFVNWAGAAEYVTDPPKEPTPPQDKLMRAQGGKSKVSTK